MKSKKPFRLQMSSVFKSSVFKSSVFNNLRDRSGDSSAKTNCSGCTFSLSPSQLSVDESNQVRRVDDLRCSQGTSTVILTSEVTCRSDDKACLDGSISKALGVCSSNPYPAFSAEADSWQAGFESLAFPEQ